jgi:hypothetical protein
MMLAANTYSTAQTGAVLVPAAPGKLIRIVKVVITSWVGARITLVSDPGPDPAALTPALHVGPGQSLDLTLGRCYGLHAQRGQALGFNSGFSSADGEYSVAVWYELVS